MIVALGLSEEKGLSVNGLMKMVIPNLSNRDNKVRTLMLELAAAANAALGPKKFAPFIKDLKYNFAEHNL